VCRERFEETVSAFAWWGLFLVGSNPIFDQGVDLNGNLSAQPIFVPLVSGLSVTMQRKCCAIQENVTRSFFAFAHATHASFPRAALTACPPAC